MAGNNYRQPYRQGPPPQRQHINNQYDQYEETGYNGGRSDQIHDSRNQGYNEYHNDHYNEQNQQPFDNQYARREREDDGHYYEPQYQEQYRQRPQNLDQGPRQQKSYQYDNRYHTNGQGRPPPQAQYGRPPPRSGEGRQPISPQDQFGRPPPRPMDSRQPLSPQDRHHGNMAHGGPGPYKAESAVRQVQARERILQSQPDSPPATHSWDNPFPTFPTKKKQADLKKSESVDLKQDSSVAATQPKEPQRPSTSHGSRPRTEVPNVELPRPRTSHSQRNVEPPRSPLDGPPLPFQHSPPDPQSRPSFSQDRQGYAQPRPPVRRAMTGPAPPQPSGGLDQIVPPYQNVHEQERAERGYNGYYPDNRARDFDYQAHSVQRRPLDDRYQNPPQNNHLSNYNDRGLPQASDAYNDEQQSWPPQRGYNREQNPIDSLQAPTFQQPRKPLPSGANDMGPTGHRRPPSDQNNGEIGLQEIDDYDSSAYRGVPLTKQMSPEAINFDPRSNDRNGRFDDQSVPSKLQPGAPYRKPTYESPVVLPSGPASGPQPFHYTDEVEGLASPLEQFSFNLEGSNTSAYPSANSQQNSSNDFQRSDAQRSQDFRVTPTSNQDRPMQYPPRTMSRPQDYLQANTHGHPSNRPPPFRPGLAQPPTANPNLERSFQDYDQDRTSYDSGRSRDAGYDRPPMPHSQSSFHSEPSRQGGYDQRMQPRPGLISPHLMPPRPATANSARPGPTSEYGPRPSSDNQQWNGIQNPDSLPAHPAPFRPGLMQSTPPAPRPTPPPQAQMRPQPPPQSQPQSHQTAPSMSKPLVEAEPPVTVGELNSLRQDYKNHPNDHALGLRFAKRLVDAAKVLANEGGRADARQTAKNRERYILDAHKIVKRLCSSGYGEAMFYMADCYGQGLLGLEIDPKEAFSLYQSAAKLGHPQAAYRVAVCCELGTEEGGGTRRDPLKAVQWYKRAASLGDTPAMYKMGMIQLKGLLGQPKSPREAISWLKRAAERADAENPHALHELGLLYENAQSTDIILKDEKYALQLFIQAAELGYKYSQFRLGSAYEYGLLGLAIDPRMSIAWYSRAAKQGEHQSEFALSGWYLTGSGQSSPSEQPLLPQSDTEAYLWARKAASSGLAKAEYAMGYYTEVGIGTASNIEEAKRWYYRAAAQNHPKARERLEDLKKGGQRMQKTRVSRSNVGKHNEGECTVM